MHSHVRHVIRTVGKALRARLPPRRPKPHRPRFAHDAQPGRDVGASCLGEESVFFADPARLAELADALRAANSPWVASALVRVERDRTVGLPVYGRTAGVLDSSFSWGRIATGPGKDVLYAVRPHRFAFAPRFALAILYEAIPADVLAGILEGWIGFARSAASALPYLSSLVVIQRSLALSWAFAFVSASSASNSGAGIRVRSAILRIVRADIDFLFPRLGTGYPNNHLLVERFAAWYLAIVFPELVPSGTKIEQLERLYVDELMRQTYEDGGGFEHSLHYHEFACETAVAYLLLSARRGAAVSRSVSERVRRMLELQVELAGPHCLAVAYGNATEDPLFPLDAEEGWATAGLRELYRSLFCPRLSPAPRSAAAVERAFWLLSGDLAGEPEDPLESTGIKSWRDSGFHVLSDTPGSGRVVFRTGPGPSSRSMPGHAHADLLSVYATSGAQAFFVDAGTWSYRFRAEDPTHAPGRAYFAGPSAHNTLTIDGIDPLGSLRGDFRDRELEARVQCRGLATGDRLAWAEYEMSGSASYDGYRRGIIHVAGECWILYDRLPRSLPDSEVRLKFLAAPGVSARVGPYDFVVLEAEVESLWIAKGTGLVRPTIAHGETNPLGGWFAPRYGERVPAPQLTYALGAESCTSALVFGFGVENAFPVAVEDFGGGVAVRYRRGMRSELVVLPSAGGAIEVNCGELRHEADVVWFRHSQGSCELRLAAHGRPNSEPTEWARAGRSLSDISIQHGGREWQWSRSTGERFGCRMGVAQSHARTE